MRVYAAITSSTQAVVIAYNKMIKIIIITLYSYKRLRVITVCCNINITFGFSIDLNLDCTIYKSIADTRILFK